MTTTKPQQQKNCDNNKTTTTKQQYNKLKIEEKDMNKIQRELAYHITALKMAIEFRHLENFAQMIVEQKKLEWRPQLNIENIETYHVEKIKELIFLLDQEKIKKTIQEREKENRSLVNNWKRKINNHYRKNRLVVFKDIANYPSVFETFEAKKKRSKNGN